MQGKRFSNARVILLNTYFLLIKVSNQRCGALIQSPFLQFSKFVDILITLSLQAISFFL